VVLFGVSNECIPVTHLSKRQLEVLQGIVDGKALKEISQDLGISVKTIEYHQTEIRHILNITRNSILVQFAIKHRLSNPAILPAWPKAITVVAQKGRSWLPFTVKPLSQGRN
jgi:DNA-binding CsgD family transcriptional regulator